MGHSKTQQRYKFVEPKSSSEVGGITQRELARIVFLNRVCPTRVSHKLIPVLHPVGLCYRSPQPNFIPPTMVASSRFKMGFCRCYFLIALFPSPSEDGYILSLALGRCKTSSSFSASRQPKICIFYIVTDVSLASHLVLMRLA